jgi:hypothetical protein
MQPSNRIITVVLAVEVRCRDVVFGDFLPLQELQQLGYGSAAVVGRVCGQNQSPVIRLRSRPGN